MHRLRGENLAYFMLAILEDAVTSIIDVVAALQPNSSSLPSSLPSFINVSFHMTNHHYNYADGCNGTASSSSSAAAAASFHVIAQALNLTSSSGVDIVMDDAIYYRNLLINTYNNNYQTSNNNSSNSINSSITSTSNDRPTTTTTTTAAAATTVIIIQDIYVYTYLYLINVWNQHAVVSTSSNDYNKHHDVSSPPSSSSLSLSVPVSSLSSSSSSSSILLPEINLIPQCYTNYQPRINHPLTEIINSNQSNWTYNISFFDKIIIEKNMNRHLGYLDYKYIFISSGINSILSLNINNQQYAHIWLCQCQKGFQRYPSYMTDLHDGADLFIQQQLSRQQLQQPLNQNHRHNSDTISNNNRTKLGELLLLQQ